MYSKQSLLYNRVTPVLCQYGNRGMICGGCAYEIKSESLLVSLSIRQIVELILSIIRCDNIETATMDPITIIVTCNGTLNYELINSNPHKKRNISAALAKCILQMWVSINPLAFEFDVVAVIGSLSKTINTCRTYLELNVSVQFIVDNYETWYRGSVHEAINERGNSHAA